MLVVPELGGQSTGSDQREGVVDLGAIVAPPPHGARMTNPASPSSPSRTRVPRGSTRSSMTSRRSSPVAVRSSATIVSNPSGRKGRSRDPWSSARVWSPPATMSVPHRAVPRRDLEAHALVERPPSGGRHEEQRPAAARSATSIVAWGQRPAEPAAAVSRRDPNRPDPADRSVECRDPGPGDRPASSTATNARQAGDLSANSNHSRRSPQSSARIAVTAGSTSAGRIGRKRAMGTSFLHPGT